MRLRKVIYAMALSTLLLSGCAEKPVEDYTKVTLAEREFSVPIKVSDILDLGFTLEATDTETTGFNQDCIGYFRSPDGAMIVANIGAMEGTEIPPTDGYAFDILEDVSNTAGDGVLEVYGDIDISSTVEEIEAIYGAPAYNDGTNKLYYKIIGEADYSDMVCVAVVDDAVVRVEVCNAKDFKEIPVATPSDSN